MTDRTAQGPDRGRDRGLSQFLFVAVGLAIIIGGLWTLYMDDAPYHPVVPVEGAGVSQ